MNQPTKNISYRVLQCRRLLKGADKHWQSETMEVLDSIKSLSYKSPSIDIDLDYVYGQLFQLVETLRQSEHPEEIVPLLRKMEEIAAPRHLTLQSKCLYVLYDFYSSLEDYENAYEWLSRYSEVEEQIQDDAESLDLIRLNRRYNLRRREKIFAENFKVKQEYAKKTSELEMMALKSQLNPHFLFNALHAIQRYILKEEGELASDYLAKFSQLMRLTLKNSNEEKVVVKEECELLDHYLQLERLRHDFKFEFKINCDKTLHDFEIPCFLLQPFVENAVIHGVSGINTGKIWINFRPSSKGIYVHIVDNGRGRESANKNNLKQIGKTPSKAIKILENRCELLQKHGNFYVSFRIFDNHSPLVAKSGTHIIMSIIPKFIKHEIKNTKYD